MVASMAFAIACLVGLAPLGSQAGALDQWQWRNPLPTGNILAGVASGDGIFVTVGDRGTILTSPDGIAWSPQPSGTSNYLAHVA